MSTASALTTCRKPPRRLLETIRIDGRPVEVAAVGQVGTLPDYRDRGLATWLLEGAHEDCRRRVPFAALFGPLACYGRFGYHETNLTPALGFLLRPLTGAAVGPIDGVELDEQR